MDENPPLDWDARPHRADGLEFSEVLDGFVVYQPERDRLHYLNPTAAALLQLCDGSLRAADLPEILGAAFSLPQVPRGEVEECLQRFWSEGLIHS